MSRRVAVAGTFGPLHDGHRALFEAALEHGDGGVVVALTSDDFARRSRSRPVPPFGERREAVRTAIDGLDEWGRAVEIRELHDEHGIATEAPALDALVVSPETVGELAAINRDRRDAGMEPLAAIVVPFVLAADGERISSTRMVAGEVDEHGTVDG